MMAGGMEIESAANGLLNMADVSARQSFIWQLAWKTFKGGVSRPMAHLTPSKAPVAIEVAPVNIFHKGGPLIGRKPAHCADTAAVEDRIFSASIRRPDRAAGLPGPLNSAAARRLP